MRFLQRWIGQCLVVFLLLSTSCSGAGSITQPAASTPGHLPNQPVIQEVESLPVDTANQEQSLTEPVTGINSPGPLSENSSSEQIRLMLLYSFATWNTLWVDGEFTSYNPDGSPFSQERVQAWIDQEGARFRVLVGEPGGEPNIAIISDGNQIKKYDLANGSVEELDFLPILTEPYSPPSKNTDIVYPHPLAVSFFTSIADLVFPSALAQRGGAYSVIGSELLAGRETLAAEWRTPDGIMVDRLWIDQVTGVILKRQSFGKGDSKTMQIDAAIHSVAYDPILPSDIFSVVLSEKPTFSNSAEETTPSNRLILQTPTPTLPSDPQFGQIYFVVNDLNTPKLVRLPADCLVNGRKCPNAEVVSGYPNINSTITPLVWSNDGEKAALVVNDRLYIYQPDVESWLLLVRSDYFYPPVWSPDGSWLAYVAADNNVQNLYIVRPDGSEIRNLTADRFVETDVNIGSISWYSPDRLYFITQSKSSSRMYRVNTRGGSWDEFPITGYGLKGYAIFSPDGQRAAGVRQTGSSVNISITSELDKDVPVVKDILTLAQSSIWPVAWSTDGERLAFSVYNSDLPTSSEVYSVAVGSQQSMKMVYRGGQVFSLNWGPTGKYILIEADQEGKTILLFASVEDGTVQPLSVSGINPNAAWTAASWRP